MTVYEEIFEVIKARKAQYDAGNAPEKSYTCYLFDKGVDKICKKVGEEAAETIIAATLVLSTFFFAFTFFFCILIFLLNHKPYQQLTDSHRG